MELEGHLLVAMPGMEDTRFARSVILICSHSEDGSMGFVLNQPVSEPGFIDILEELELEKEAEALKQDNRIIPVFRGGPVEQGRGFVVHTLDYGVSSSARVGDLGCVTATLDALRKLSSSNPPQNAIMLLGYSGWSEGQLDDEIVQNGWLTVPATHALIFETPFDQIYEAALKAIGVSEMMLSTNAGHA